MRRIFWIFLISFFSFYIIADDLLDSVLLKKTQEVVNESSNTPSSEQSIQQSSTDVSNQKVQDFSLNTGALFESKEKKEAIEICAIYRLGDVDSGYDIEFSVPISSTFSLSVRGAYFTSIVIGIGITATIWAIIDATTLTATVIQILIHIRIVLH